MNETKVNRETENAPRRQVVVNDEEQYSIWPEDSTPPSGWRPAGFLGTENEALDYIERVWTDMRPKSVREALAAASEGFSITEAKTET
ncbi:MbtH family NRPS accessory protein [Nonomuraea sp. NPDC049152]|uniref:MbtH family protein n=1 Tax=Nonomuraea sp. NPDC049152 TaxID=3154350 RepID=UPI0033E5D808